MHEGYPGCTSASYFSLFFHPDFLIFCTQQIHLTKSGFQNQWMLHFIHFKDFLPQTTKRVGDCAWSQTQTEPVFLRNLSKVVIQPETKIGDSGFSEGFCGFSTGSVKSSETLWK